MSISAEPEQNKEVTNTNTTTTVAVATPAKTTYVENEVGKKRKLRRNGKISRWGPVPKRRRWGTAKREVNEDLEQVLNSNLDAVGTELNLLRIKLQAVTTKLANTTTYMMSIPENERSPSPPPIYDNKGVRLNTREIRVKKKLIGERDGILTRILQLNPKFKPPQDWKRPKVERKIYVPVHEYPDVNFFGLIIGPRGAQQKKLQKDTGTKIAIRGKGSFQEGKQNRIPQPDDNEPMHVLISGPDDDSVERASVIIRDLLIPITETETDAKAKQLRALALRNGTMITANRCRICNGSGHPVWKCPERSGDRWTPANVQCAICGELSHVTADCKLARGWSKSKIRQKSQQNSVQTLEDEYANFMKDLVSGKGGPMGGAKPVAAIQNSGPPTPAAGPPSNYNNRKPYNNQNNHRNNYQNNNRYNNNNNNNQNNNFNRPPPQGYNNRPPPKAGIPGNRPPPMGGPGGPPPMHHNRPPMNNQPLPWQQNNNQFNNTNNSNPPPPQNNNNGPPQQTVNNNYNPQMNQPMWQPQPPQPPMGGAQQPWYPWQPPAPGGRGQPGGRGRGRGQFNPNSLYPPPHQRPPPNTYAPPRH